MSNMSQNCSDKNENRLLKLTVSCNDQLTKLNDSNILENDKKIIKKVMSLNTSRIETKQKHNTSQKTFKIRLFDYKMKQFAFIAACKKLKTSFESIEKFKKGSLPDNNVLEFEQLDSVVQTTWQKIFGETFSKPEASFEKDHEVFVFNCNIPLTCQDINSTTGYQKLDLPIKEAYKYVWNNFSAVSEMNKKYRFWLQNVIDPNEFNDLYAVRKYLTQNMFNKEQNAENIEAKLNDFYNNLQLKFINIINEADDILNPENKVINKNEHGVLEANAETKLQTAIEEHTQKMDMKIKMLEMENEKLRQKESVCVTQFKTLVGELSFRNSKLNNAKDRIKLLTKEKNDLISIIQKMEAKGDNYQVLKNKIVKEQQKNHDLRTILEKKYEKKDITF